MHKATAQTHQVQAQAAAHQTTQQQASGTRTESPQGERIAQLAGLAKQSPASQRLAQLTAIASHSPGATAQRALAQSISHSPRQAAQRALTTTAHASSLHATAQRAGADEEELQRKAHAAPQANRTGLPSQLKSGIESLSGMSLDNVRVHYNSPQPAQLNAHAYAQGTDIHVAPGQEKHLPHEAWHVVQQAQGRVKPTMQMKSGVPVNDDAGLEREADVMGRDAMNIGDTLQMKEGIRNSQVDRAGSNGQVNAGLAQLLSRSLDVYQLACYSISPNNRNLRHKTLEGCKDANSGFPSGVYNKFFNLKNKKVEIIASSAGKTDDGEVLARTKALNTVTGQLDHIVPESLGGGGVAANGRVLAANENTSRGNNFELYNDKYSLDDVVAVVGTGTFTLDDEGLEKFENTFKDDEVQSEKTKELHSLFAMWPDPWRDKFKKLMENYGDDMDESDSDEPEEEIKQEKKKRKR